MPRPHPQRPIPRLKEAARRLMLLPRRLTAAGRTLPHYLIIGTQKGGTTSLHADLARHPAVAPALRKEPHFFDVHWSRGPMWYRAHFPRQSTGRISGEATPSYLFLPQVPARVRQLLPEVKLIVMLRHPVDRAWSHYHHERQRGHETLSFEEAIESEPQRIQQNNHHLRHFSYLARGRYAVQIERWLQHFPREQMLVIRSEDYRDRPATVWAQVLTFLQLPAFEMVSRTMRNVGTYRQKMPATLRDRLQSHFKNDNEALYALLGRDMQW